MFQLNSGRWPAAAPSAGAALMGSVMAPWRLRRPGWQWQEGPLRPDDRQRSFVDLPALPFFAEHRVSEFGAGDGQKKAERAARLFLPAFWAAK